MHTPVLLPPTDSSHGPSASTTQVCTVPLWSTSLSFPSWNTFFPLREILLSVLRPTLFQSCSSVFKTLCRLQCVRQWCKLSGIQRTKSPASPAPRVLVLWFKKQELHEMWFAMQTRKVSVERAFMLHLESTRNVTWPGRVTQKFLNEIYTGDR